MSELCNTSSVDNRRFARCMWTKPTILKLVAATTFPTQVFEIGEEDVSGRSEGMSNAPGCFSFTEPLGGMIASDIFDMSISKLPFDKEIKPGCIS